MAMGNSSNDGVQSQLLHVHVCVHCGHTHRREEAGVAEIRSGIFSFPDCGEDGPLNIEIRELPTA
jgi:hypothetical protein